MRSPYPSTDWSLSKQECSQLSGCGVRSTSTTSSSRSRSMALGPHGTLTLTIALGKQCAHEVHFHQTVRFFAAAGGLHCWHAQHNPVQFRVRCAVLHSQLKFATSSPRPLALRINPIDARAHTHRSHSQTSTLHFLSLLSPSTSVRGIRPPPVLAYYCLSYQLLTSSPLVVAFSATINATTTPATTDGMIFLAENTSFSVISFRSPSSVDE